MAEIKSTLELAMERTKRLAISNEEKREIKQKEIAQRATSLSNRYIEEHLSVSDILKEIERMEEGTAIAVKDFLLSRWIGSLSLNGESERLVKGIESLKDQHHGVDDVKRRLLYLISQYQGERKDVEKEVSIQAIEALKREGIYGSAVEPPIEEEEFFRSKIEELKGKYESRLREIKEELRAL
jgi:hypothetical protein